MLTGITGGMGSGKTLIMTLLGYLEFLSGKSVQANYHLHFPFSYLNLNTIMEQIKNQTQLQNIVLLIDEIHIAFDARTSMSGRNRFGSYFVLQTRKRDVQLYFTTQSIWQVDIRIRENLDRMINCRNYAPNCFEYEIIDYRYESPVVKKITMNGSKIYNLYDTNEIIDPMRTPVKKDTRKNHHKKVVEVVEVVEEEEE
jgi:hypothetical protein